MVLAAVFVCGWLIPLTISAYHGGAPESWPMHARDLYSVSCLFGTESDRVSVFYVQVRREHSRGWETVEESQYFELEPFGHRNRFDRFMARFGYMDSQSAEAARAEFARWIAARESEGDASGGVVIAVRYLWLDVDLDGDPQGCWRKPDLAALPPGTKRRRLGEVVPISARDRERGGSR